MSAITVASTHAERTKMSPNLRARVAAQHHRLPPSGRRPTRQTKSRAKNVQQHRDHEQEQADLGQGRQIQAARGLAELVRDHARHRVRGREQGRADFAAIADHHGDGHGFTERATQAEDRRAYQAPSARTATPRRAPLPKAWRPARALPRAARSAPRAALRGSPTRSWALP